jgi:hypothetical protein
MRMIITERESTQKRRKRTMTGPPFRIQSSPSVECPNLPRGEFDKNEIKPRHRQALWEHFQQHGAVVLPNAVGSAVLSSMNSQFMTAKTKPVQLRSTVGNVVAGNPPSGYAELDTSTSELEWLQELESRLWLLLLGEGSPHHDHATETTASNASAPQRKSVLLQYGEGAENWAHQDNNREQIPVQAVLLLSDPSTFSG